MRTYLLVVMLCVAQAGELSRPLHQRVQLAAAPSARVEAIEASEDQQWLAALVNHEGKFELVVLDAQLQVARRLALPRKPAQFAIASEILLTASPARQSDKDYTVCQRRLATGEELCADLPLFLEKVFLPEGQAYGVTNGSVYRLNLAASGQQLVQQFSFTPPEVSWAFGVHRTLLVAADGASGQAVICRTAEWQCTRQQLLSPQQREWAVTKHPNELHFGPDSVVVDGDWIYIHQGRRQANDGFLVNVFRATGEYHRQLQLERVDLQGKQAFCLDAAWLAGRAVCTDRRTAELLVF